MECKETKIDFTESNIITQSDSETEETDEAKEIQGATESTKDQDNPEEIEEQKTSSTSVIKVAEKTPLGEGSTDPSEKAKKESKPLMGKADGLDKTKTPAPKTDASANTVEDDKGGLGHPKDTNADVPDDT